MDSLYRQSFTFKAVRFEEYQDGVCLRKGVTETTIKAREMHFSPYDVLGRMDYDALESKAGGADIEGGMKFVLSGNSPSGINKSFNLPIMDEDVLSDRIQYGRLLSHGWEDPDEPVVCNIFNNRTCIRFAMNSPLRIIEFYGSFINEANGESNKSVQSPTNSNAQTAKDFQIEQKKAQELVNQQENSSNPKVWIIIAIIVLSVLISLLNR